MNKEQFLNYFKEKENNNDKDDVTIINVISPATSEVTNAKLAFVSQEFNKSAGRPKNYQKNIPENVRKEVGKYALIMEPLQPLKGFLPSIRSMVLIEHLSIIGKINLRAEVIMWY